MVDIEDVRAPEAEHPQWSPDDYEWNSTELQAQRAGRSSAHVAAPEDGGGEAGEEEETFDLLTLPRLTLTPPGKPRALVCCIDGCGVSLTKAKPYYQRFRLCDVHVKCQAVLIEEIPQRLCQQCGRWHPISHFDFRKRTCRAQLERIKNSKSIKDKKKSDGKRKEGGKRSADFLSTSSGSHGSGADGSDPSGGKNSSDWHEDEERARSSRRARTTAASTSAARTGGGHKVHAAAGGDAAPPLSHSSPMQRISNAPDSSSDGPAGPFAGMLGACGRGIEAQQTTSASHDSSAPPLSPAGHNQASRQGGAAAVMGSQGMSVTGVPTGRRIGGGAPLLRGESAPAHDLLHHLPPYNDSSDSGRLAAAHVHSLWQHSQAGSGSLGQQLSQHDAFGALAAATDSWAFMPPPQQLPQAGPPLLLLDGRVKVPGAASAAGRPASAGMAGGTLAPSGAAAAAVAALRAPLRTTSLGPLPSSLPPSSFGGGEACLDHAIDSLLASLREAEAEQAGGASGMFLDDTTLMMRSLDPATSRGAAGVGTMNLARASAMQMHEHNERPRSDMGYQASALGGLGPTAGVGNARPHGADGGVVGHAATAQVHKLHSLLTRGNSSAATLQLHAALMAREYEADPQQQEQLLHEADAMAAMAAAQQDEVMVAAAAATAAAASAESDLMAIHFDFLLPPDLLPPFHPEHIMTGRNVPELGKTLSGMLTRSISLDRAPQHHRHRHTHHPHSQLHHQQVTNPNQNQGQGLLGRHAHARTVSGCTSGTTMAGAGWQQQQQQQQQQHSHSDGSAGAVAGGGHSPMNTMPGAVSHFVATHATTAGAGVSGSPGASVEPASSSPATDPPNAFGLGSRPTLPADAAYASYEAMGLGMLPMGPDAQGDMDMDIVMGMGGMISGARRRDNAPAPGGNRGGGGGDGDVGAGSSGSWSMWDQLQEQANQELPGMAHKLQQQQLSGPHALDEYMASLTGLHAGQAYLASDAITRVSTKLFNCLPSDLPPHLRLHLLRWVRLAGAADVLHGAMRPGCVEVVLDVLHSCTGTTVQFNLAGGLMANGSAAHAAAAAEQALTPQLAHQTDFLVEVDGLVLSVCGSSATTSTGAGAQQQQQQSSRGGARAPGVMEQQRPHDARTTRIEEWGEAAARLGAFRGPKPLITAAPAAVALARNGATASLRLQGQGLDAEGVALLARKAGRSLNVASWVKTSQVSQLSSAFTVTLKDCRGPGVVFLEPRGGVLLGNWWPVLLLSSAEEAREVNALMMAAAQPAGAQSEGATALLQEEPQGWCRCFLQDLGQVLEATSPHVLQRKPSPAPPAPPTSHAASTNPPSTPSAPPAPPALLRPGARAVEAARAALAAATPGHASGPAPRPYNGESSTITIRGPGRGDASAAAPPAAYAPGQGPKSGSAAASLGEAAAQDLLANVSTTHSGGGSGGGSSSGYPPASSTWGSVNESGDSGSLPSATAASSMLLMGASAAAAGGPNSGPTAAVAAAAAAAGPAAGGADMLLEELADSKAATSEAGAFGMHSCAGDDAGAPSEIASSDAAASGSDAAAASAGVQQLPAPFSTAPPGSKRQRYAAMLRQLQQQGGAGAGGAFLSGVTDSAASVIGALHTLSLTDHDTSSSDAAGSVNTTTFTIPAGGGGGGAVGGASSTVASSSVGGGVGAGAGLATGGLNGVQGVLRIPNAEALAAQAAEERHKALVCKACKLLGFCCLRGMLAICRLLLRRLVALGLTPAYLLERCGCKSYSLLQCAVLSCRPEMLHLILHFADMHGVPPNLVSTDSEGLALLHLLTCLPSSAAAASASGVAAAAASGSVSVQDDVGRGNGDGGSANSGRRGTSAGGIAEEMQRALFAWLPPSASTSVARMWFTQQALGKQSLTPAALAARLGKHLLNFQALAAVLHEMVYVLHGVQYNVSDHEGDDGASGASGDDSDLSDEEAQGGRVGAGEGARGVRALRSDDTVGEQDTSPLSTVLEGAEADEADRISLAEVEQALAFGSAAGASSTQQPAGAVAEAALSRQAALMMQLAACPDAEAAAAASPGEQLGGDGADGSDE